MIRLQQLPQATERVLHGLTADQGLKQRILSAAVAGPVRRGFTLAVPRVISILCVTAGVVMLAIGIAGFRRPSVPQQSRVFTSATHTSVSPILLRSFMAEGIVD